MNGEELTDAIAEAIARGEYLEAFDLSSALDEETRGAMGAVAGLRVEYYRCLSLARAGSQQQARTALAGLMRRASAEVLPDELAEDIAALDARLAKDVALALEGRARTDAANQAARRYEAVYRRLRRPFACINAATLYTLAGDVDRGRELATEALRLADASRTDGEASAYWDAATRAEAAAVLGDEAELTARIGEAGELLVGDRGARSTTVRQLGELFDVVGFEPEMLAPLRNPGVLHFCGHRAGTSSNPGRLPPAALPRVQAELDTFLDTRRLGAAHGSLASGADILIAEACLQRAIELHTVLPFSPEEFARVSVAPAGEGWVDRFWRCLNASASVTVACDSDHLGDDVLYGYAAMIAMGSARNRAASWVTDVAQLAVWDGDDDATTAGTSHDIRAWARTGGATEVIDSGGRGAAGVRQAAAGTGLGREIRPILFGDVKGFSRLDDSNITAFLQGVMAPVGAVLRAHPGSVLVADTWGDGVKAILDEVGAAAAVAIELQAAIGSVDLADLGLPADMGIRVSGHVGPVLAVTDPVTGAADFAGRELTRAARIEPRTPVGAVYVTAAFAALLALEPDAPAAPEYVGTLTTAKDFETIPMYVLVPRL